MDIFELFPVVSGPENGTQNLVNVAIIAALFIVTLTLVGTVIVKVIQGILWVKANFLKRARVLKQNVINTAPKKAEEFKRKYDGRRRRRLYAETVERFEIEERVRRDMIARQTSRQDSRSSDSDRKAPEVLK